MRRLGRWLESLAGWWDGVRLPLGHARTPRWVGEDSGAVRTQPRAPRYRCPKCRYTYVDREGDGIPLFCPNDDVRLIRALELEAEP